MKVLFSIIAISIPFFTFSQDNSSLIRFGLNSDYNIESLSNKEFNNYLINNEYYSISNIVNNISLGFSIRPVNNFSMMKVNFYNGESLMENSEDMSVLYSTGFGFDYLYDFVKREAWFVAPSIGVRLCNYKLAAVSKNSFSPLTKKYIEEILQTNNIPLVNLGMQVNREIKIYYLSLYIGLKGGYNINFISNDWKNSSVQTLNDIPKINLSGLNFGFSLRFEFNESKMKGDIN